MVIVGLIILRVGYSNNFWIPGLLPVDPRNENPIEFILGNNGGETAFSIPRHYFEYTPYAHSVKEFTLEVRLPDLIPEVIANYENKKAGFDKDEQYTLRRHSLVRVKVTASGGYSQMQNLQDSILPDEVKDAMNFEEVYGLLDLGDEMRYSKETRGTITVFEGFRNAGITFGKNQQGDVTKGSSFGSRYFVPKNPSGKEGFYIECAKPKPEGPITYCRIKKDIGSSIRAEIGFSFDNFPDWKVVDQKVTDFLKSHMVDK